MGTDIFSKKKKKNLDYKRWKNETETIQISILKLSNYKKIE